MFSTFCNLRFPSQSEIREQQKLQEIDRLKRVLSKVISDAGEKARQEVQCVICICAVSSVFPPVHGATPHVCSVPCVTPHSIWLVRCAKITSSNSISIDRFHYVLPYIYVLIFCQSNCQEKTSFRIELQGF